MNLDKLNVADKLIIPENTLLLLLVFAVGTMLFGLILDLLSLRLWLTLTQREKGRLVGLPFIPWMLYFLSFFFWFLRGNAAFGAIILAALTVWHIALHITINTVRRRIAGRNT